jgi:uncharacterized HAD superfamily protein
LEIIHQEKWGLILPIQQKHGAEVILITGPTNQKIDGVDLIRVVSAEEMYASCHQFLKM